MKVQSWNEEFEGRQEPLIDCETFYKNQDLLNHNDNKPIKRLLINPDFPLKDRLCCGCCGKRMTAAWCEGSSQKYPLYYCKNSKCHNHSKKSIKKGDFENEFFKYLEYIKPQEKHFEKFRSVLLKRYEKRQTEFETKSDWLRKQLDSLSKEKKELIGLGRQGVLEADELKEELSEIRGKIMKTKLELNETHTEEFKIELLLDYADSFFRTLPQFWLDAGVSTKIKLQRIIFPEGIVYSYPGFSNSKISRYFKLIEDVATSNSRVVTPLGIEPRLQG